MSDNKLKLLRVIDALEKLYIFRKNIVKNTLEYSLRSQTTFQEVNEHDCCYGHYQIHENDFSEFLEDGEIVGQNGEKSKIQNR